MTCVKLLQVRREWAVLVLPEGGLGDLPAAAVVGHRQVLDGVWHHPCTWLPSACSEGLGRLAGARTILHAMHCH